MPCHRTSRLTLAPDWSRASAGLDAVFFFFLSPSLGRSDILRDNYLATGHEYNTDGTPRRLTVKPALSLLAVNSCHSPPPLPPSYVISRGCIIHMQQHLLRREYIHCLSHTVPRASGVADGRASLMVRTASRHYSNAFITAIKKFTRGGGSSCSSPHRHRFGRPSLESEGITKINWAVFPLKSGLYV